MSDVSLDFSQFLPDPEPTPDVGVKRDNRSEAEKLRHTEYANLYVGNGSHAKTCRILGYSQLRMPESHHLRAEIKSLQDEKRAKFAITPDNVLKEYARMAYFDARKLADENGNPIPLHKLDDETATALAGLEIVKMGNDFSEVLKYKAPNKQAALDSLSKNLGLFKEDNEQAAKGNGLIDEMSQNELARRLAFFLQENLRKQVDGAKEA